MATRKRRSFGQIKARGNKFFVYCPGLDGKLNHTPGYGFNTRKQAEQWLAREEEHLEACRKGYAEWIPPKQRGKLKEQQSLTVGDWINRFYNSPTQAKRWKRSTHEKYLEHVYYRLTGDFLAGMNSGQLQHIALAKLTRADILEWWEHVSWDFPDKYAQNHKGYIRLRQALKQAVVQGLIPFNPAENLGIPLPDKADKYLPTDQEIYALIAEVPERYRFLAVLTLAHGLRLGEALALDVGNIVIEQQPAPLPPKATVQVRQNLTRPKGADGKRHNFIDRPKTSAGVRDVPLLQQFVPHLLDHLEKYAATPEQVARTETVWGVKNYRFMFPTSAGKLVAPQQFQEDVRHARKQLGIDGRVTPHTGRNWLITKLLEMGVPPNQVGEILGQEDLKTIMHYAKMLSTRPREYIDRLSDSLGTIDGQ